jgi:dUTP pyrophosphatase
MEDYAMNKVAKFEKVSISQFIKDFKDAFNNFSDEEIINIYNEIKLPKRATKGSAGYDFFSPISFALKPNESIKIPTGIRVKIEEGWFLANFPRSGLGFKYRLQLNNTVGIIDSDYYNALNEGHIFSKITNATNEGKTIEVLKGQGFVQGIFIPFGITIDDEANEERIGGFGSTTK